MHVIFESTIPPLGTSQLMLEKRHMHNFIHCGIIYNCSILKEPNAHTWEIT